MIIVRVLSEASKRPTRGVGPSDRREERYKPMPKLLMYKEDGASSSSSSSSSSWTLWI